MVAAVGVAVVAPHARAPDGVLGVVGQAPGDAGDDAVLQGELLALRDAGAGDVERATEADALLRRRATSGLLQKPINPFIPNCLYDFEQCESDRIVRTYSKSPVGAHTEVS